MEDFFLPNSNWGYDIIDRPFYCGINSGEDYQDFSLYIRSVTGIENPELVVRNSIKKADSEILTYTGHLDKDSEELIGYFLTVPYAFIYYLNDKELWDEFSDMDFDIEGILVSLNNDELTFKRVHGKKRPDMVCKGFIGSDTFIARPYKDEVMASMFGEDFEDDVEDAVEAKKAGHISSPPGMDEAFELMNFVEEEGYNDSTDSRGLITIDDKMIAFAAKLAIKGNKKAQLTLSKYFLANECTKEQELKAMSWIIALADEGNKEAQEILKQL